MQPAIVHLAPGTVIAGKFRVLRLLGVGGMGVVYEIEHELTKHRRALKLLHSQFCAYPAAVARFLREASAAGRIGNAHIVETFDAGQLDSGEPYIVMEQLEGETLADRIGRESELSVGEIADIVAQSCVGIHAAHERGIVHRDLKPENIFIEQRDGKPFTRILDFGVSKFDEALTGGLGLTGEGLALGTPFYMPPEQIRGEKNLDARADVYALGVILYEAVTGRRPYEAETLPHLAVLIHEGNAATVESLRPDLPPAFTEIVHRAMASDPAARFQSARELGEKLAPFVRDPTVSASETPATDVMRSADVSRTLESVVGPAGTLVSPGGSSHPPVARTGARTGSGTPMSAAGPMMPEKRAPLRRWLIVAGAAFAALLVMGRLVMRGDSPSTDVARSATSAALPLPSAAASPASAEAGVVETARPSTEPPASALAERPAPSAARAGASATAPRSAPPRSSAHAPSRAEQKGLANENPFR